MVLPYKGQRNVFVLGPTDEIKALLDESLMHVNMISTSKHVGPIKPKVDEWVKLLDLFASTLVWCLKILLKLFFRNLSTH